jgi:hypothetical protein
VLVVELVLMVELEIPVGDADKEVPVIVGVIVVKTPLFSTDTMGLPVIVDGLTDVTDDSAVVDVDKSVKEDDVVGPTDH